MVNIEDVCLAKNRQNESMEPGEPRLFFEGFDLGALELCALEETEFAAAQGWLIARGFVRNRKSRVFRVVTGDVTTEVVVLSYERDDREASLSWSRTRERVAVTLRIEVRRVSADSEEPAPSETIAPVGSLVPLFPHRA